MWRYNATMTPEQCRAGRSLIGWTQQQLAAKAGVGFSTVRDFEKGRRQPYDRSINAMRAALESAGIAFIAENGGGAGVRFAKPGN